MMSFSEPPLMVPVFPFCRRMESFPELPDTLTRPVPIRIESSPASPMIVPGPVSPLWFSVSVPAVPVTL